MRESEMISWFHGGRKCHALYTEYSLYMLYIYIYISYSLESPYKMTVLTSLIIRWTLIYSLSSLLSISPFT